MKAINLLGSTGSIGVQSLDVARKHGGTVASLAAYYNITLLEAQVREFRPKLAAVVDEKAAADLKVRLRDTNTRVLSGIPGVCECAACDGGEITVNAIVGMAGLRPALAAIEAKKTVALANKETLVAGGNLVTTAANRNSVAILPVDSEHSAIFQCLQGCPPGRSLSRIILTASGGPFFGRTKAQLKDVTVENALNHPNWSMGAKITIDSATMFNKGLELIEAVWLFGVTPEQVDIVVHRESIIHSMIEYDDNSVIAQLGYPDMRLPIQYALTYPLRLPSFERRLNLAEIGTLSFFEPDYDTFVCINICRDAIKRGGLFPAAANSANEEANRLFREGKIPFLKIGELVGDAVKQAPAVFEFTVEDVENTDILMRNAVNQLLR